MECKKEVHTPTDKMGNLVQDHTCGNEGYEYLNLIRKYRDVNSKEMDRVKGEIHSGSMNIIYILQIPKNFLNTPSGEKMFMPFVNNLVNRRLQS